MEAETSGIITFYKKNCVDTMKKKVWIDVERNNHK